jgi:hypothetical protein
MAVVVGEIPVIIEFDELFAVFSASERQTIRQSSRLPSRYSL